MGLEAAKQLALADPVLVRSAYVFFILALESFSFVSYSFFQTGQETEFPCIVWTDIQTSSTSLPQEARMECSVSGMWDKATCPPLLWRPTQLKVRLILKLFSCLTSKPSHMWRILFSVVFLAVWEVHFHPTNPDHLFTCSEDGSLLHWETSSQSDMPSFLQGKYIPWYIWSSTSFTS